MLDSALTADVISLAVGGDEVAFTRIVEAHHADMLRIAYVTCGDVDVAADAAQAAWVIAWRRLGSLNDPRRLRPWLMSVAANEARQQIRGRGRRRLREISVIDRTPASTDPAQSSRIDLANALATLDPRDRALLGLRYIAGLDSTEAGREVGMSPTAVRSRLSRSIGRLRKELGDE